MSCDQKKVHVSVLDNATGGIEEIVIRRKKIISSREVKTAIMHRIAMAPKNTKLFSGE